MGDPNELYPLPLGWLVVQVSYSPVLVEHIVLQDEHHVKADRKCREPELRRIRDDAHRVMRDEDGRDDELKERQNAANEVLFVSCGKRGLWMWLLPALSSEKRCGKREGRRDVRNR